MIPQANIVDWRVQAPWSSSDQIEHDLVLSRALCELYSNPLINEGLVFRGGTALHKLYFDRAGRFSEDLDFVQVKAGPIGKMVTAIRDCLDHWLGKPSWKQNQGRFTFYYRFTTEVEPVLTRKVKIEINTREHFSIEPFITHLFQLNSPWFQGEANILSYTIEELLATKLRALYQRKKGRDLYDFWYAASHITDLNIPNIIDIFQRYMEKEGASISRAEFEKNLTLKQKSSIFNSDIRPLLAVEQAKQYQSDDGYKILFRDFLPKLNGEPWKGLDIYCYVDSKKITNSIIS
jgi:predicted nucleotidyltransferase component of viral defense system